MYQLEGFVDPERLDYICKLTKALYGLKQAPRVWFNTFSNLLIDFWFVCSKYDPSLFTFHHQNKTLVLLMYVDNILLTGSDDKLLQQLLDAFSQRFSMKNLRAPKYFLGIQTETYSGGRGCSYINKLTLKTFFIKLQCRTATLCLPHCHNELKILSLLCSLSQPTSEAWVGNSTILL